MIVLSHTVMGFMADTAIRATVLLALTAIVVTLSRRASASFRHLVWSLGLASALCLPLLCQIVPSWHVAVKSRPIIHETAQTSPTQFEPLPITNKVSPIPISQEKFTPSPTRATSTPSVVKPIAPHSATQFPWAAVLIAAWITGVMFVLAQLVQGLFLARRIGQESVSMTSGPIADALTEAKTVMQITRPIALRQAALQHIAVPIMYGARHPVIVLPTDAAEWPLERLRAALLHELAHVQRSDYPMLILAHIARAFYWFHPLAWLAAKQARAESETACDDLVLSVGMPAQEYARHLLDVVLAARDGQWTTSGAVAMAQTPKIEGRLRAILALGLNRQTIRRKTAVRTLAMAILLILPLVALRPEWVQRAAKAANLVIAMSTKPEAVLPNGVTVKLVGVTNTQATEPSRWWAADGSPVTEALPKNTRVFPALPSGLQGRAFAVTTSYNLAAQPMSVWALPPQFDGDYARVNNNPSLYYEKPSFTFEFDLDTRHKSLGHFQYQETRQGSQVTQQIAWPLSLGASQKTVLVRYAEAAGPWTESVTCQKTVGKVTLKTPSGRVIFTLIPVPHGNNPALGNARFMVSDYLTPSPRATANSLQVALHDGENYDRKVLGLDSSGRVVADLSSSPVTSSDNSNGDDTHRKTMQETHISNLLLKKIAAFRLLARPFYWTEFRNVQLQPLPTKAAQSEAVMHVNLGQQLQQRGQPRDGIPEFRKALEIDPDNADAQQQLAVALSEIKYKHFISPKRNSIVGIAPPIPSLDEAIQHMQYAVSLRPNNPEWHCNLGSFLAERGRDAEAVAEFRKTLKLLKSVKPSNSMEASYTHSFMGTSLLRLRQYTDASAQYQQAIALDPEDYSLYLGLGDALNGAGHPKKARIAWKQLAAHSTPSDNIGRQVRQRLAKY